MIRRSTTSFPKQSGTKIEGPKNIFRKTRRWFFQSTPPKYNMHRRRPHGSHQRKLQKPKRHQRRNPHPARVLNAVINDVFHANNRSRLLSSTDGEEFTLRLLRILRNTPFKFDFVGLPPPRILRRSVAFLEAKTGCIKWVHYSRTENNSTLYNLLWIAHFTNDYWSPPLNIGYPPVITYPITIFKHSDAITKRKASRKLFRLLDNSMKGCASQNIMQTVFSFMF